MTEPPRIRMLSGDVLIVPSTQVHRPRSHAALVALVEELTGDSTVADDLRGEIGLGADVSSEELQRRLVDALWSGELRLVKIAEPPRLLDAPSVQNLADLGDPEPRAPSVSTTQLVRLSVVDELGRAMAALSFAIDVGGTEVASGRLDGAGEGQARVPSGSLRVRFPDLSGPGSPPSPVEDEIADGRRTRVVVGLDGSADPQTLHPAERNDFILRRPRVWRPRDGPFPVRPGSSLALPARWRYGAHAIPFVLSALEQALALTGPVLLFVGHAKAEGDGAQGGPRADALRCLIEGDRDGWVSHATKGGTPNDVHDYLQHLATKRGWSCVSDGADIEGAPQAVLDFQVEFNRRFESDLLEDGICGTQTLGAIFDVLRDEWATWTDDRGISEEDVARVHISYADTRDAATDAPRLRGFEDVAGIHAFVLDRHQLTGDPTVVDVLESRVVLETEYPVHWHYVHDDVLVRLDLVGLREGELPVSARLYERSGLYDRTIELLPHGKDGGSAIDVTFSDAPSRGTYSLSVRLADDPTPHVILADVPFDRLLDDTLPPSREASAS